MTQQELPEEWAKLATRKGVRATMRGLAEAAGVAPSTVSRLVTQARSSQGTVHAVAEALGVEEAIIWALAGMSSSELGPYVPPRDADSLSATQRAAIDAVIRAMAEPRATITAVVADDHQRLRRVARDDPDTGDRHGNG